MEPNADLEDHKIDERTAGNAGGTSLTIEAQRGAWEKAAE